MLGDGAYLNCGMAVPHRKRPGRALLQAEEDDNAEHRKVRARVEHVIGRMKNYKIPRDCQQRGHGLHHAVQAVAHRHNLALASRTARLARTGPRRALHIRGSFGACYRTFSGSSGLLAPSGPACRGNRMRQPSRRAGCHYPALAALACRMAFTLPVRIPRCPATSLRRLWAV